MNQTEFYQKLCTILAKEQIFCQEPMNRHTTFRTGGLADYFVTPQPEQAAAVIALCRKEQMPYQVIGNGSNLLVGDLGIRGVTLAFAKPAAHVEIHGNRLTAGAGALLSQAAAAAYKAGLGGMEFAAGIPGSVGGAVVMNAGAYGGELKDILSHAVVLTTEGEVRRLDVSQLELSYRHSCIPQNSLIVLEAEFVLDPKPAAEIKSRMEELKTKRTEKQPLEYPSAGSTFKRPQGYFAGKLIMDAGLAGFTIGGAQVSQKHCGFVINKGGATSADIAGLIHYVQETVQRKYGVTLEPEVKYMGEFAAAHIIG